VHAASVDFKGFTEKLYNQLCGAHLEPIMESVKLSKKHKLWTEVTSLVIPSWNDNKEEVRNLAEWLKQIDAEMPLHLIAFHPSYKMLDTPSTTASKLMELREVALDVGLKYVYVGNVHSEGENTYCPNCSRMLIERTGYMIGIKDTFDPEKAKCTNCGQKIAGVWTREQAIELKGNGKLKK
jgi:pyruvate formate lyase activating enzyme